MGKESNKERRIGQYVVRKRTAQQLVVETRRRPLVTVAVMWGIFLPIAILIAPWMGGARLFIAVAAGVILVAISLLVVYFTPARREIVVDLDLSEFQIGRDYLFPRRTRTIRIPHKAVKGVRRSRRAWRAPGEVEKVEWVVDLVGEEGEIWPLVEGEEEGPAAELARLVAEVAGRPLEGQ